MHAPDPAPIHTAERAPAATPSLAQVAQSVGAAFFGVQSSRNRKRDFTHGRPLHFVMIALLMTGGVALVIYTAVKIALRLAGVP